MSLLSLLYLTGCVNQAVLASNHDALKKEVADALTRTRCAPVDLAVAQAELAFAEIEMDEGDPRRADQHVATGRDHVRAALACQPGAGSADSGDLAGTDMAAASSMTDVATPTRTVAPAPVKVTRNDADRDGVNDDDDICPKDPEDLDGFKDGDGCPDADNDSDGIPDTVDKCPDAAEDKDGFSDADGCPEADNDADGVTDAQDGCPNEPGTAALKGCPSKDTDNDGIVEPTDQCPTLPETKNGFLDDDGCPDSAPITPPPTSTARTTVAPAAPASTAGLASLGSDQISIGKPIEFAAGKATISTASYPILDSVAAILLANPDLKVEIGGHTDNQGDDAANQTLSKDRADAVFEYLLSKGVPAKRLRTVGYGETQPVDTNMTEVGRSHNRRIEFVLVH